MNLTQEGDMNHLTAVRSSLAEQEKSGELSRREARIVKELVTEGRQKGYLTLDDINQQFADSTPSPEQADQILNILAELDIDVGDAA